MIIIIRLHNVLVGLLYTRPNAVDNIKTQVSEAYAVTKISPTPVIYDECNPSINNQYEIIR